jgi:hypothetical protein
MPTSIAISSLVTIVSRQILSIVVIGISVGAAVLAGATSIMLLVIWERKRKYKYIEHEFE